MSDNSNYKMLSLKQEPIIANNVTIMRALKKNGITTIQDILDFDDDTDFVRMNAATKSQVRGIIGILKYKYMKEDLLVSPLLTEEIYCDESGNVKGITFGDLYRMGFTRDDVNTLCLYHFGEILEIDNRIKLIDFFKKFIQKVQTKSIVEKMKLYIDYYDGERQKSCSDISEVEAKLQQMQDLTAKRDEIDNQIMLVEAQLQGLSEADLKGKKR